MKGHLNGSLSTGQANVKLRIWNDDLAKTEQAGAQDLSAGAQEVDHSKKGYNELGLA